MARISKILLNNRGNPCLVLDLGGNVFSFSPLKMMLSWVCHIWLLSCLAMYPLCPLSREVFFFVVVVVFNQISVLNIVTSFFFIYGDVHMIFILQFVDAVCHMICGFLNYPCIPGINLTWSWCLILLVYCWIGFADIFWGFLRIFSSIIIYNYIIDIIISFYNFLFCDLFVWFWYQIYGVLIEWAMECAFHCNYFEEFHENKFLHFYEFFLWCSQILRFCFLEDF